MTYGVYSRDLKNVRISDQYSIGNCKKYLFGDDVVCSERTIWCEWVVKFIFHRWRGFHYYRYGNKIDLGFVSIETHSNYRTWADKIVYDPQAMKGETK